MPDADPFGFQLPGFNAPVFPGIGKGKMFGEIIAVLAAEPFFVVGNFRNLPLRAIDKVVDDVDFFFGSERVKVVLSRVLNPITVIVIGRVGDMFVHAAGSGKHFLGIFVGSERQMNKTVKTKTADAEITAQASPIGFLLKDSGSYAFLFKVISCGKSGNAGSQYDRFIHFILVILPGGF